MCEAAGMAKHKTTAGRGPRRQTTVAGRGRFYPGEVFVGVITDYDYSQTTYSVNANNQTIPGVQDMTGMFSALIGFKTIHRLAVGTTVAVVFGTPSYIVGTTAADPPDSASFQSRITTGTGIPDSLNKMYGTTENVPCHNHPDDLYEGEFEITNLLGTFFRFMTFMASIGSGERAKIECHLLRDLVRIISRNYSGDFKMFDDGRLNVEMHGTTYPHERWGQMLKNDPKFKVEGTGMPEVDPLDTGRWRYDFLLGYLGDLFNCWFTDPPGTVGRMAEECVRSGKARMHVGQDGNVLVQSTSEIALERVTRVLVPIRIRHEEDPDGVLKKEMDKLDQDFIKTLKMWDQGGEANEHNTLFQIREYARYLNQYHSLARLIQQSKDWTIPNESNTPQPTVGSFEEDRIQANNGRLYWKDCYSTIRIFRDGSILTYDAYGNAMASGPYGIQHSSTRHISMFAAGDIILKAGGSIFQSARRHVEIAAHRGALLLKARTSLRALCESGTLWLKSDLDPDNPYVPEDGDPEPEAIANQGIRVQAVKSETRWISKLKARFSVDKDGESLEFASLGGIMIDIARDLDVNVRQAIKMKVQDAINITAKACYNWLAEGWLLSRVCHLKPGSSKINKLEANGILSRGPIGGPKHLGHPVPGAKGQYVPHTNHIQVYEPKGDFELKLDDAPDLTKFDKEQYGFSWKGLSADEYGWTNDGMSPGKNGYNFEPLAQQTIRLSDTENYGDWERMADLLRAAPETSPDLLWPGADFQWKVSSTTAPDLQTATDKQADEFGPDTKTDLTLQLPTFKFLLK